MSFLGRLFIFVLILLGMILFGGLFPVIAHSATLVAEPQGRQHIFNDRESAASQSKASPLTETRPTPKISENFADFNRASSISGGRPGFFDGASNLLLETIGLCSRNSQGRFFTF